MANKIWWDIAALTGGDATALDYLDGSLLTDGDVVHVFISGVLYVYRLNGSSSASENSPWIITPNTNPGTKRWEWQNSTAVLGGPTGALLAWPTETPPTGWLERNGASLVRATYAGLFAILGTAYGAADASHFNLMDDRGLFPRYWDHGKGVDPDRATRTAPGATGATISAGDHVGTEQANEFKSHAHATSTGYSIVTNGGSAYSWGAGGGVATLASISNTGGNETRPVNRFYMPIIKF